MSTISRKRKMRMTKETKFIVLILAGLALSIFVLLASLKLADKPKLESPREVFLALVFDAYTVNYYRILEVV